MNFLTELSGQEILSVIFPRTHHVIFLILELRQSDVSPDEMLFSQHKNVN